MLLKFELLLLLPTKNWNMFVSTVVISGLWKYRICQRRLRSCNVQLVYPIYRHDGKNDGEPWGSSSLNKDSPALMIAVASYLFNKVSAVWYHTVFVSYAVGSIWLSFLSWIPCWHSRVEPVIAAFICQMFAVARLQTFSASREDLPANFETINPP